MTQGLHNFIFELTFLPLRLHLVCCVRLLKQTF